MITDVHRDVARAQPEHRRQPHQRRRIGLVPLDVLEGDERQLAPAVPDTVHGEGVLDGGSRVAARDPAGESTRRGLPRVDGVRAHLGSPAERELVLLDQGRGPLAQARCRRVPALAQLPERAVHPGVERAQRRPDAGLGEQPAQSVPQLVHGAGRGPQLDERSVEVEQDRLHRGHVCRTVPAK